MRDSYKYLEALLIFSIGCGILSMLNDIPIINTVAVVLCGHALMKAVFSILNKEGRSDASDEYYKRTREE